MFKNLKSKKVLSLVLSLLLLFSCTLTTSAKNFLPPQNKNESSKSHKSAISNLKLIIPASIVGMISVAVAVPCIYGKINYSSPRNPIDNNIKGESDEQIQEYDTARRNLDKTICTNGIEDQDEITRRLNLKSKIKDILDEMNNQGCETDYEKALFLHDYMCEHFSYDFGKAIEEMLADSGPDCKPHPSYGAQGCLLHGKAICLGIARAYTLLLTAAGLTCKVIYKAGRTHAWTIVKINDQWYHVDMTFDMIFKHTHKYAWFMLSADELPKYYEIGHKVHNS